MHIWEIMFRNFELFEVMFGVASRSDLKKPQGYGMRLLIFMRVAQVLAVVQAPHPPEQDQ